MKRTYVSLAADLEAALAARGGHSDRNPVSPHSRAAVLDRLLRRLLFVLEQAEPVEIGASAREAVVEALPQPWRLPVEIPAHLAQYLLAQPSCFAATADRQLDPHELADQIAHLTDLGRLYLVDLAERRHGGVASGA